MSATGATRGDSSNVRIRSSSKTAILAVAVASASFASLMSKLPTMQSAR